jgi:hypothetical protein
MKKFLVLIAGLMLAAAQASAYESDSHLRISYVLARAAGLSDSIAKYLSTGNQYVDETALTSAMLLSSQRQLYHFHGDAAKVLTGGHGGTGLLSSIFKSKLALAERNHALGSVFIYHGLVNGDLQLLSAGTHTKMDTFGHAGFSNLLGHAPDGHSPDRAFLEPKKYEDMIREMMATYVAVKEVLPKDAAYIDNEGALEYLNKYAERTHLGRKLTMADMSNAVTVATVLLADTELQSIYREDIYKKYEYKKIALQRIYESFKAQGKINADVTFNDLFPEEFIRNSSAETTDVIIETLMKNAHSEFLKTLSGKDIFDLPKLLEGQTEESYLRRYRMEVDRYEARLREIKHMEVVENTLEGQEKKALQERIEQEKIRLFSGLGESANIELMSEAFIKARAEELAQLKLAEEMANHLTKDFIPRRKNEYIKHQFEGEYENRAFENHYKDEAYRRFIHKNFGVNWVMDEGRSKVKAIFEAIKGFKEKLSGKTLDAPKMERWKVEAEKAAAELIRDTEVSMRETAQKVGFTLRSKIQWFLTHGKYVLQAAPVFYGFNFIKKLSAEAKKYAHDHMSENMADAVRRGKYKPNIIGTATAAQDNVQRIRAGTRLRCSYIGRILGGI